MALRTWVIGGALAIGYAVALTPPAWLVWNVVHPQPLNAQNLRVRFESVRYEAGGLVFSYSVDNTTGRSARFLPGETEIHALQSKDRPVVGFANVHLPVELPAHSLQTVELRLELPAAGPIEPPTEDQDRAILNPKLPSTGSTDQEAPVSPLPMMEPPKPQPPPRQFVTQLTVEDSLLDLNGFELTDHHGLKLVFPRGW